MTVFCVIPAYNEEAAVGRVVREILPLTDKVVVVDDGSTDRTAEAARTAGAVTLRHVLNRGQGAALRTGTDYCLTAAKVDDLIVHFDADGQMRAEDLPAVLAPLREGRADICFGSRFLREGNQLPPVKKHLIMPLARLFVRLLGIKTTDPQSGFRAMTARLARELVWSDGRVHCSEILLQAHQAERRLVEAPIIVNYFRFGTNTRQGFGIIKDLFIGKLIN